MSADTTVVIPAFNAASTLADQLAALEAQSFRGAWEILVCDNGSTDGTPGVVREWQPRLPGLRLVHASERRGSSHARNVGAAAAAGEVLLFCDADDVVSERWVEAMVEGLSRADAVGGAAARELHNARVADRGAVTPPLWSQPPLPWLPAASSYSLGVRTAAFEAVGGFDESLRIGEDLDLCWRLQLAGYSLGACPAAVVHVRDRPTLRGIWRQAYGYGRADRQLEHRFASVRAAYERLDIHGDDAPPEPAAGSRWRSKARAASRMRRPADLSYVVRRTARRAGYRLGRIDERVARVDVPQSLPVVEGWPP